ncbi:Tat pathway signal sequence domain protein [Streptomyces dysideae]|uniref:Tat pathway signal sequence domain protein n=1 Tax=Streptomyces dysideae TaxID=909626 RepID=A0A101V5M7_9ACTN|nr:Tat pathway signal sequence domain protein [Streptomyces dysideae]KUO22874.1 Tat pathway signal sequence domain protein [Streptomyces dysideae]
MSGVGPVEPGEGTRAWDAPEPGAPLLAAPRRGRLARLYARRRRSVLVTAIAAVLLAGGGYLYATRPQEPPPAAAVYPSLVVDVGYLGEEPLPAGASRGAFSFAVKVTTHSGPPVTVLRVTQPYSGISLSSAPRLPVRTAAGSSHKIVITMHVTECANVPQNAGLPFLDVTLRNTRAMQVHSFILGERYAHDLSEALRTYCGSEAASGV